MKKVEPAAAQKLEKDDSEGGLFGNELADLEKEFNQMND